MKSYIFLGIILAILLCCCIQQGGLDVKKCLEALEMKLIKITLLPGSRSTD
ncbi:MAG: hypothetical protein QXQ38_04765 [Archaeoglobaceae archaeon]